MDRTPRTPDAHPRATWGPWTAIGGTVGALFLGLLLALPIVLITGSGNDELSTGMRIVHQAMAGIGFVLMPFLIAGQVRPRTFAAAARRLGFVAFRPGNAIKWMAIALISYIVFAAIWADVFGAPEQDDIAGKLGPAWSQILLIVILAPLAEEVCFRGLLFGGLRTRFPFPAAAIGAGLIFGLLHYSTGWSTVPQLAVLGALFALVYERTGSLWPPILLHVFNNAFVLTVVN